MNVMVFVPVGFLLGFRIQDSSFTIRKALLVALMGCGISGVVHGEGFMVKGSWLMVKAKLRYEQDEVRG